MDPRPDPQIASAKDAADSLARGVQRSRAQLAVAALIIVALASFGFVAERIASARAEQIGAVARAAVRVQRLAWDAESGARAYLLVRDSAGIVRTRAAQDSLAPALTALRALVADEPEHLGLLDTLETALATWDSVFARPTFETGSLTLTLALSGTRAFDEAVRVLDAFIAAQSAQRAEGNARAALTSWSAFLAMLATLAIMATIAWRLTRALEADATHALSQRRRIEEQAGELEQQASLLAGQAALLQEQAADLRARVVEADVTNRLLMQTGTFLDTALESAPIGIAFYDRGLRFQRINETLAQMNGAPADAHIGRRLDEMVPALAATVRPILERVLESGAAEANVVVEGETPARPGDRRRFVATYYPIARPGEPPVGVGAMVLDATEQHHVEQQLRQAQKLEAVGRLAGGIAHDFNNMLTVIQSYAEVLSFEFEAQRVGREEIEAIRAAADRATALARQLLAFTRRDVVVLRDVDVNAVVRALDLILRRLIRQDVELTVELSEDPLIVRFDSGQLEQVVMNLVINAVDAMPEGGKLRLSTTNETSNSGDPRARAMLCVSDTGTGMSAEVLDRLFEPFFTTKPPGQGTGLGLATTYAIVTEAGGTISVQSRVGNGSRFVVSIPLADSGASAALARATPAGGIAAAQPGEVVLLVEDEPAIRKALSRVLTASGYRVIEAAHGGEALKLAEAEPGEIHLVLSDVMMPGIGGKELVQRLLAVRPATRVILMSGFTDDLDLREALGEAKFLFLQKPFAPRRALAAVRQILDAD